MFAVKRIAAKSSGIMLTMQDPQATIGKLIRFAQKDNARKPHD